ncbi:MAG: ABC transporter permease [Hyphomicrobium sp.]|uniref:ABC transporter permease n=1 Tax=Hyphomicrobium sp. TaxID=82 RepID=UPI0039E61449
MKFFRYIWESYVVLYLLILYAPILFLAIFAFNASVTPAFPLKGFTTQWFAQMTESRQLVDALWNSLKVATSVSIISTILGGLAAKAIARKRLPGKGVIAGLLGLPLIVPAVVIGIALLILLSSVGLPLSLNAIRAAHVLFCIPFAMLVMLPRFEAVDPSLEEASRDLGEGLFMTFVRVVAPMSAPAIIASLLLTFTVSLDEFMLAFFLAGNETTLPLFIWSQLRFPGRLPSVLALSTCILVFSFVLVGVAEWFRRLGNRNIRRNGEADVYLD